MKKLLKLFAIVLVVFAFSACNNSSKFGTFTDTRDVKIYKTVKIGTQIWMAENLNYKTNKGSWCYDDNSSNCDTYGRLYNWETACKVCPAGWHLPSDAEWTTLTDSLGEKSAGGKLKKAGITRWSSPNADTTNEIGFNALPCGWRNPDGSFSNIDIDANFWTSTPKEDNDYACSRFLGHKGGVFSTYWRVVAVFQCGVFRTDINATCRFEKK